MRFKRNVISFSGLKPEGLVRVVDASRDERQIGDGIALIIRNHPDHVVVYLASA
ncbi:hypothetical protein [Bradyrhizobium zhanjiangense]|uniref:hypothetical protein n=1 Tax=Bradyrhizobium zhanjiangense TaxID=1325107 RepID=UPI0013E8F56F|nr:hypothetical protein [Bradyrhizobium zhanjiangense]